MKIYLLFLLAAFSGICTLKAADPSSAASATFVPPCQRFVQVTPSQTAYGCYTFSVTNPSLTDLDSHYTWYFGDGQQAQGKVVTHCYGTVSIPTAYTVSMQYTSMDCPQEPIAAVYTVQLMPPLACESFSISYRVASPSATVDGGVFIPETIMLIHFGDNSGWTPYATHTYSTCGNFTIRAKIFDINRPGDTCHYSSDIYITCPGTVTPVPDHPARKPVLLLDQEDHFLIRSEVPLSRMTVHNAAGQLLCDSGPVPGEFYLPAATGLYVVTVQTQAGELHRFRVLKR